MFGCAMGSPVSSVLAELGDFLKPTSRWWKRTVMGSGSSGFTFVKPEETLLKWWNVWKNEVL